MYSYVHVAIYVAIGALLLNLNCFLPFVKNILDYTLFAPILLFTLQSVQKTLTVISNYICLIYTVHLLDLKIFYH